MHGVVDYHCDLLRPLYKLIRSAYIDRANIHLGENRGNGKMGASNTNKGCDLACGENFRLFVERAAAEALENCKLMACVGFLALRLNCAVGHL